MASVFYGIQKRKCLPGSDIVATSGTTMRVPVKSLLSPA